jgi:5-hydroxyisourate hydrolase-like protein (transthyretin family)
MSKTENNFWKYVISFMILMIMIGSMTVASASSGNKFPDSTPLQDAIKQAMANGSSSVQTMTNGNFSLADIEGTPEYSIETLEKNDTHIKLRSTTKITFKNPRGAGYVNGKWPKFEIKDDPELRKNGIIKPGDYDQAVKDYIVSNIKNIKDDKERTTALANWDKYGLESGPRTDTIEEIYEVTYPKESLISPLVSPSISTTSNGILMGFTKNPIINWIVTDRKTFLGLEIYYYKAGFELDAALGLRLPIVANLNMPGLVNRGQNYMMSSSIVGADWNAASYSNANVPPENGNEFVARLKYFLGVVVRIAYIPVVDWHIEANKDYGRSFKTPIGPAESFPIPNLDLNPGETGLNFGWSVASIGIGLVIHPYLSTSKITADWLASGDARGSGLIQYNAPSTTYNFGPVSTGDYNPSTDLAFVGLSNFKYYFNLCRIDASAPVILHLGWTGFSKDWNFPIDIGSVDCSGLFGGSYLGIHQGTNAGSLTDSSIVNIIIPPSITVVAPNGGDNWQQGTTHTISWSETGFPGTNVKIELLKGTVVNSVIVASTSGTSYSWAVPTAQTLGTDYKIRITSTTDSSFTDTSNNNFVISAPPIAPSITVVAPNGGDNWQQGTTHTISWSKTGNPGANVKIELLKGTAVNRVIITSISGTSYSWAVPTAQTLGKDYKIRITSTSDPSFTDASNNNFVISAPPVVPSITVTSPNGGEKWKHGTTHTITWSKTGNPGTNVKIELLKGTAVNRVIIASKSGTSYTWAIPATQTPGTDYKIRITGTTNKAYKDTSNNNFIIIT